MATAFPTSRGLPDPHYEGDLYQDVPTKRLFAWMIDVAVITFLVVLLTFFSFFTALFFLPLLYGIVSFLYRWTTLAGGSATLGMRMMAIEIRQSDGSPMDGQSAFLHTAGYFVSFVTFPLQLISVVMMVTTARRQGLSDAILGTAAVNRARY